MLGTCPVGDLLIFNRGDVPMGAEGLNHNCDISKTTIPVYPVTFLLYLLQIVCSGLSLFWQGFLMFLTIHLQTGSF